MEKSNNCTTKSSERRQRLHELLIALISQQGELELIDAEAPNLTGSSSIASTVDDPARWMERNKRIIEKYQSLVRSAITLDALLESEQCEPGRNSEY